MIWFFLFGIIIDSPIAKIKMSSGKYIKFKEYPRFKNRTVHGKTIAATNNKVNSSPIA